MKNIEAESFKRICDVCDIIESRTGTKASRLEDQVTVLIDKYLASHSEVTDLKAKLQHEEEFGAHQLAKRTEAEDKLKEILGEMLQGELTGGIEVVTAFVRERAGITGPHLVSVISQLVSKLDTVRDEFRICRNDLTNEKIQTTELKDRIKAQRKARAMYEEKLNKEHVVQVGKLEHEVKVLRARLDSWHLTFGADALKQAIEERTGIKADSPIESVELLITRYLGTNKEQLPVDMDTAEELCNMIRTRTEIAGDSLPDVVNKLVVALETLRNHAFVNEQKLMEQEGIVAQLTGDVNVASNKLRHEQNCNHTHVVRIKQLETQVGELKDKIEEQEARLQSRKDHDPIAIRAYLDIAARVTAHTGFKVGTPTDTVQLLIDSYLSGVQKIDKLETQVGELKVRLNSWHSTSGADNIKQTIAIRTGFKGETPTETVGLLIKGYFAVIKELGEVQAKLNESKAKLRESDTAMLHGLQQSKPQAPTGVLDRDKLNLVAQIFCAGYNFTPAQCLDRAETLMSLCSNPKG